LHRETLELNHAISLAIEAVQPLLDEKRHEVIRKPSPRPLHIEGDLARIVQCIANLLNNSAKYTEPGGEIEVALEEQGDSALMKVIDSGSGISPKMLPRVFELFVQADRTLDRSQGGLGIGLAVVDRLIRMHGGHVTADSEGLGHGSTFRISLPLSEAREAAGSEPSGSKIRPKRILIVDDNRDAADSLAKLLSLQGHATESAYGAVQALELQTSFSPDVVLLDIGLPDMDGYEVAEHMRAKGSRAVIVALTGYGQAEDIRRAYDAGFDAHVTKPVALADLQRILQEHGLEATAVRMRRDV
jgi:CheY-like chemotaxis protein